MPVEVIMPKVDMDMTHGTFATWHVAEGEEVRQGAPLFDIETEKAAMEVEAPSTGRLHHMRAEPGQRIEVGTTIAWLYGPGEDVGMGPGSGDSRVALSAPSPMVAQPSAIPSVPLEDRDPAAPASPTAEFQLSGIRATPAARAAVRAAGIDLREVPGSGPLGRVQRDDVSLFLKATRQAVRAPAPPTRWVPENGPLSVTQRKGHGTPVLLIHGFTADSRSWAPLERELGLKVPLIRIDLPGHGHSPKRRIRGFADLARMVVEAFDDAVSGHDCVHIMGHSLGGAVAIALADTRARRIASLTLLAPSGLGPEIDADALTGIVRASRAESLAPWLRRMTAKPEMLSDDYVAAAFRPRADPALRACQAEMSAALFPDGVQGFDLRPALTRLSVPSQIVWGRQDQIIPNRQVLTARGDFGIHLLDEAGHVPQLECPERVARIALRLMAAVDALGVSR